MVVNSEYKHTDILTSTNKNNQTWKINDNIPYTGKVNKCTLANRTLVIYILVDINSSS